MPNITDTLATVNAEPIGVPVVWYQHTSPPISFNIENDAGAGQDLSGYTFEVNSCVSTCLLYTSPSPRD